MQGRVLDATGAALSVATVHVQNASIGFDATARTDGEGRYHVPAIPSGDFVVTAEAAGFRTERIDALRVDVGRSIVRDFRLQISGTTDAVRVSAEFPLLDRASATVSHVVTPETVQEIPLNGRHFTDLGLLVPGSVAPSQAGFSSRPIRGVGTLAFNTGGNREEAVGFVVNGVSTNNLTFGSLIYEPPLVSVREFTADTSTFSTEHGHVSGALIHIVTQSGTDDFRASAFEFFRNDALDARNFFEFTSSEPHPFKRNQFGGSLGGPIFRGRTYFFAAVEAFRHRQGVDLNSLVLSDDQRAAVTDPVIRQLLPFIPVANYFDSDGTPRFVGSARAVVDSTRWTLDLQHRIGARDRIHGFYGNSHVYSVEPTTQGNSVPGFGTSARPITSVLTIGETHIFGSAAVNEARFGRTGLIGGTFPATALNPASFGIGNGVTTPIGLPQLIVAGDLNFGGPGPFPQGRFDTSYVFADTFAAARGRHAWKTGVEYRHFINENFAEGTGVFNFPSVEAFMAGTANAFNTTLGRRESLIDQHALAAFAEDRVSLGDALTLELGLRYEWHVTPTERDDRFVVFDTSSASLVRIGQNRDAIYGQNHNLEPRVGVVWTLSSDRKTVLRSAYRKAVDEPGTTAVRDTASNPPFGIPLTASGSLPIATAIDLARPAGLAPASVDPALRNASVHAWNVNVQRQLAPTVAATIGYSGSHGTDLRLSRNINQPVDGVRPFPLVGASSAILPGTPLGNITQVESSGWSNYHAAWVAVTKRLSRGLQFDGSYTWSKSLDTNSLNSLGFAIQDSNNIAGQYGLSDFDARHRVVLSGTYARPTSGHVLLRAWRLSAVVQSQSGNPVNIVTSTSAVNGVANSVRPDVTGPISIIGSVDRWFDPSAFVATTHFGNLGRNVVIGPAFHNTDLSVGRTVRTGPVGLDFRVDIFDVFNHANFGPPGNIVGSPTFGKITRTRLPTGEAGSSRQIQFAVRLSY